MKKLLMLFVVAVTGCASIQNAGTASYSVKPFVGADGKPVCCEVTVNNGKEIALLEAKVIKKGDDYEVYLREEGVVAFEGQRIAAGAAKSLAASAVKAAAIGGLTVAAPVLIPAVGAALASEPTTLPAISPKP